MVDSARHLAHTVLAENLRVRKGESVVIESWPYVLPYARAMVEETRRLGAQPLLILEDEDAWWAAVDAKQWGPLRTLSKAERAAVGAADVFVHFFGPEDTARLDRLPKATQDRLFAWNEGWYRLAGRAGVRGCRMYIGLATDGNAATYGLDRAEWARRLVEAGEVSGPAMAAKGAELVRRLSRGSELRVRHPNGTDLTIHLDGLHTRVDTGVVDPAARKRPYGILANSPSGQVMVAIDRAHATGRFVSNRLVYVGDDKFGDADWTFEGGRLTSHALGTGTAAFEKQFAQAKGKGRDVLGFLSLGLNPKSRDLAPCEDTEEGAVLVGIGDNTIAGGRVKMPFRGYALLGEGTVEIDGRRVAASGRLR